YRARRLGGDVHGRGDAMHRVEEVEVQLGLEVVTTLWPRWCAPALATPATEQVAEDVAEAAHVAEVLEPDVLVAARARSAEPAEAARSDAGRDHLANLVVLLALLRVTEDVVGCGYLLEALFGDLVTRVGVRVVLLRELPIGARDVLLGRTLRHTEHLVVV